MGVGALQDAVGRLCVGDSAQQHLLLFLEVLQMPCRGLCSSGVPALTIECFFCGGADEGRLVMPIRDLERALDS